MKIFTLKDPATLSVEEKAHIALMVDIGFKKETIAYLWQITEQDLINILLEMRKYENTRLE